MTGREPSHPQKYATDIFNNTPLIPRFSIFVSLLLDNDVYYNLWENRIIVSKSFVKVYWSLVEFQLL